ncbi:MAG: hypothetical protein HZA14_11965 [Nitrospirae bacterium]|nr:hypothetical protein [Nitrospirota bacterium]
MEVARGEQVFSGMRRHQAVSGGFFRGTGNLISRGFGLGIVLFLALSTLSALNQIRDVFAEKLSGIVKQEGPRRGGFYPAPGRFVPSLGQVRPQVRPRIEAGQAIRESGYFLRSLDEFVRSLSSLAR